MVDGANANATAHKTPPPAGVYSPEIIKSTGGTAAISENTHTISTKCLNFSLLEHHRQRSVDDIRSWIMRDIKDHSKCEIDEMLLAARAPSLWQSSARLQHKETLLGNVFCDVLKLCDESMKEESKKHFVELQVVEYYT